MKFLSSPVPSVFKTAAIAITVLVIPINQLYAANSLDIVINEIAWMGTEASYNDEWIELYDNTGQNIDLSGWKIAAKDGKPEINLTGTISANGFYLLERTDDETVPSIAADQIYTGVLGNQGEWLSLYDNAGNLIDSVNCSSGWFGGDNSTKQTAQRVDTLKNGNLSINWTSSANAGGTPRKSNGLSYTNPSPTPSAIPEPSPTSAPKTTESPVLNILPITSPQPTENDTNYPSGIIINEIMPSPQGPDETEEWIEIFNQNGFSVNLSGWQLKDAAGKVTVYVFPEDKTISAKEFSTLRRPETKIALNNDGDGLKLLQPNGNLADSINYEKAPTGQSYAKIGNEWQWNVSPSPGSPNVFSQETTSDNAINKNETTPGEGGTNTAIIGKGTAAIENTKPDLFPIGFIALFCATISGIAIFFLKSKLKKNNEWTD